MQINSGWGGCLRISHRSFILMKKCIPGGLSHPRMLLFASVAHIGLCAFRCRGSARTPLFWRDVKITPLMYLSVGPATRVKQNLHLWVRTISFRGYLKLHNLQLKKYDEN